MAEEMHYDRVYTHLVKIEYEFGPKWNAHQPDFVMGATHDEVEAIVENALKDQKNFNERRKRSHRHKGKK